MTRIRPGSNRYASQMLSQQHYLSVALDNGLKNRWQTQFMLRLTQLAYRFE